MHATFCPTCGETRWRLTGLPVQRSTTCAACGTELKTERRLPNRKATTASPRDERRIAFGMPPETPSVPPTALS